MWITGICSARARFNSFPISSRAGCTLASGSLPSVYSRCASITTTVESESGGGALLAPAICNRVLGSLAIRALAGFADAHKRRTPGWPSRCSLISWLVAGLPNSERPQHDCADECDNRDHHQDIELHGQTHVQPPWLIGGSVPALHRRMKSIACCAAAP